jgi:DNA-binding transcriptional ArsR family regulator
MQPVKLKNAIIISMERSEMLAPLFGSYAAEKVLIAIAVNEKCYAQQLSTIFGFPLSMFQNQLVRYENAGILSSRQKGRTRFYVWNENYPYKAELKPLLIKAFENLSEEEKKKFQTKETKNQLANEASEAPKAPIHKEPG